MNFSPILETIVSLAFIYFLFSVVVSLTVEYWTYKINLRGKMLKNSLEKVFTDLSVNKINLIHRIYEHPLIDCMRENNNKFPSYIDSNTFARSLIEVVSEESKQAVVRQDENKNFVYEDKNINISAYLTFISAVQSLKYSKLKTALLYFINQSGNVFVGNYQNSEIKINNSDEHEKNLEQITKNIETWYNSYMDRVSGWYKRGLKVKLMIVGLIVATTMNIDSLALIKRLWTDPQLRATVVNSAEKYISNNPQYKEIKVSNPVEITKKIDSLYSEIGLYELPIGWGSNSNSLTTKHTILFTNLPFSEIILKIIGIALTGIALSFGAPFWFDVLNKFVNIRKAGVKP